MFLGCQSKIFVLPAPGQQDPHQITLICRYMKFYCRYTGVSRIHSHATITNPDKCVEITMVDNWAPPRKFTTFCQEYMDLRMSVNIEVFHAVIPHVETETKGPSLDYLVLVGNPKARDLSNKMVVCPSAWWWHIFQI